MPVTFINIADLKDPNDGSGRTYRQVNAEKEHQVPVGSLVELETGARLFVVYQGRDCDMTPLYWLTPSKDDLEEEDDDSRNQARKMKWSGGYSEGSLKVVVPHTATS